MIWATDVFRYLNGRTYVRHPTVVLNNGYGLSIGEEGGNNLRKMGDNPINDEQMNFNHCYPYLLSDLPRIVARAFSPPSRGRN